MEDAFDQLDYDSWYALMTEDGRHPRVVDVVKGDNFAEFVEAHEAGLMGDVDTADSIRQSLGLGVGSKMGSGNGQMMMSGTSSGARMQQHSFIDADGDGNCDNEASGKGRR